MAARLTWNGDIATPIQISSVQEIPGIMSMPSSNKGPKQGAQQPNHPGSWVETYGTSMVEEDLLLMASQPTAKWLKLSVANLVVRSTCNRHD